MAATSALLALGTACQLVVDVDYRFTEGDADAEIAQLGALPDAATPSDRDAAPAPPGPVINPGADDEPPDETPEPSEPEPSEPEPSEPPPTQPEPSEPEPSEPEPEPLPLPPDPVSGCSIIEYCYAHQVQDTTDEERCIQKGCALEDAIAECRAEIAVRCGTAPQPPFVMITVEGQRVILN